MKSDVLILSDITFAYPSSVEPVLEGVSCAFYPGWTGIVGANGSGKTTLLQICAGALQPDLGQRKTPSQVIYCAQRTDDPPTSFAEFLISSDAQASRLSGMLGVIPEWSKRWRTLSHGERRRAQLAVALWRDPEALLLDEPTNHVDVEARETIVAALHRYRGIGLIVSHDRDLLDALCGNTVFVARGSVTQRTGGYSAGMEQERLEVETARKEYYAAREERLRIEKEMARRRRLAQTQQSRRSKRNLPLADHDARFKRNLARLTGKDGTGGKLLRQMDGRLSQAELREHSTELPPDPVIGIDLGYSVSRRDRLFSYDALTISLGTTRRLLVPPIEMRPTDRVALSGPNGCGKSSLLRTIVERLDLPSSKFVYLPQEIDRGETKAIVEQVRAADPAELGFLMAIVSRLGSDPERLLQTPLPSPGETRKLMLALGMRDDPELIILDEPTNHMDVISIECLERTLSNVKCGLLLVSHDTRFTRSLSSTVWSISRDDHEQDTWCLSAGS